MVEAETCKRELVIQIPPDVVAKESESVAAEYARKARIPGFRPGRVPRELVLRRFREAIRDEVAQSLLPRFFKDAVKERQLSVVGNPKFEDLKFESDQPLTCKATFEIYPAIDLGEYKGLQVAEDQPAVNDADIDEAIEKLREGAATYEVAEGRPAVDGDILVVNYEGRDRGAGSKRIVAVKEGTIRLGAAETLQEFTDGLRGARVGEVRHIEVSYPAEFRQADVAGKVVKFRIEVVAIKRKVLPSVDDGLAKTVSDVSTLEELRTSLRKKLEAARQRETERATKGKLLDVLIERHPVPVPAQLVEERMNAKLRHIAAQLSEQGIDPEKTKIDWPKMRAEMREEAEKEVRGSLILEKVAEKEGMEISDEELDEAIRELATGGDDSPAALKTRLTRNGGLARLQSSRLHQKALDFVYRNAQVARQLRLV